MPELISIEEAARITGFPYEEIEDWVKSRKITSFHTRTGTRMVDIGNLRDFITHIEHLGIQKLYLQLVIQDKEEEADEIIAQYDDYLFCLRSLKNISPLLKQIIAELSTFIDDKQDRYIFTEITSGAKILDVAKRISLPVTSLTLSPYIRKCLQKLELETMEDLLRYARKKGLDSLLKIPGFGPLGLDQLKFQLEKHKIMNKAGDSDLYQYIIKEPDSWKHKKSLSSQGCPFYVMPEITNKNFPDTTVLIILYAYIKLAEGFGLRYTNSVTFFLTLQRYVGL